MLLAGTDVGSLEASRDTYVALLRGINVGGRNRLPMDELARSFEHAGCASVKTYIQSGNVVFVAAPSIALKVRESVAAAVSARVGTDIPIVLRSAADLARVVGENPFLGESQDPRALHVGFLADKPSQERVSDLDPDRSPPDEFAVRGKEIYLRLPNGMSGTRFTASYVERVLATPATFRNWRTVENLLNMAAG